MANNFTPPASRAALMVRLAWVVESFQKLLAQPFSPPRLTMVLLWSSYPASAATTSKFSAYGRKKLLPISTIRFPLGVTVGQSSFLQADKPRTKQQISPVVRSIGFIRMLVFVGG